MRLIVSFCLLALAAFSQSFKPGEAIEYKDGSSYPAQWEKGVFVKMLPGGAQALIRKKPSQFFPEGSETAYAIADIRSPHTAAAQPTPPAAAPARSSPPTPATAPPAGEGLLTKEQVLAYAKQLMGPNPWGNPSRDAILDQIRDYVKARGTRFQPDLDFSNRMGAQGTYSVHIGFAAGANYGPRPAEQSYFGTWLLRAANRGSQSYTVSGGRPVVQTTDSQAESGQLTINPDGTYAWQVLRGQSTVLKGNWRWVRPGEMHAWEGGPAIWLLSAKQGADYMVRGGREPGYAGWIDVGAGKGRTPVEYGRRP